MQAPFVWVFTSPDLLMLQSSLYELSTKRKYTRCYIYAIAIVHDSSKFYDNE